MPYVSANDPPISCGFDGICLYMYPCTVYDIHCVHEPEPYVLLDLLYMVLDVFDAARMTLSRREII